MLFELSELVIVGLKQVKNISVISYQEQVTFWWDDADVCLVLYQHAQLDFYSASSLKEQSNCRHDAPFWQIIMIQSQPVFALTP